MKKFKIFCLLLGLLCIACEKPTESNYYQNVKSWIGKTPEELITSWGEPTQVINNNNRQYYIYMVDKDIPLPGTDGQGGNGQLTYINPLTTTPAYNVNLFCQTTFIVREGIIVDWLFEGNACKAY